MTDRSVFAMFNVSVPAINKMKCIYSGIYLPLNVFIDHFVSCFVLAACFSSKMVCISDSLKVASFSFAPFLGFKNSSPREKLGSSSSSTGWLVAILS